MTARLTWDEIVGLIALMLMTMLVLCAPLGCQSQDVKQPESVEVGEDGEYKSETDQSQRDNNPWPYVVICGGFLVYLWADKKYVRFGRK